MPTHRQSTQYLSGFLFISLCGCAETDATAHLPGAGPEPQPDAGPEVGPSWVLRLDPTRDELPGGLVLNAAGDTAFLGLAPTGQILAIDTEDSSARSFGSVPAPPRNGGYLFGLALNEAGELFAAVASASESYQPGIYRLPASGGEGTLFASHPKLTFPNGLAADPSGGLFVTDSLSGTIFHVDPDGVVSEWASDPLLEGALDAACTNGAPFPIGANGIALFGASVFVVNSNRGSLLQITKQADGSAGAITPVVAGDCTTLGGADGLAVDAEGTLFVAANAINSITRITDRGEISVLQSTGFDFPASVALQEDSAGSRLFVTSAAFNTAQSPGATPEPGLLVLPLSVP